MIVVVGIGSNLGSRVALVLAAAQALRESFGGALLSPLYLSAALTKDGATGPDYVNAAARIETALTLQETIEITKAIETRFGRTRAERWADRTLDLDLLWATETATEPVVPHPELEKRGFALAPLLDVAGRDVPARYAELLEELGRPQRCELPVVRIDADCVEVTGALDEADAFALARSNTAEGAASEWVVTPLRERVRSAAACVDLGGAHLCQLGEGEWDVRASPHGAFLTRRD